MAVAPLLADRSGGRTRLYALGHERAGQGNRYPERLYGQRKNMTARQSQAFSRMSVGSALYFAAEIIRLAVVMMVVVPVARLAGIGMMVVAAAEVNSGIGHGAADQRENKGACRKKLRHGFLKILNRSIAVPTPIKRGDVDILAACAAVGIVPVAPLATCGGAPKFPP